MNIKDLIELAENEGYSDAYVGASLRTQCVSSLETSTADMHWLLDAADDYVQSLWDMDRHGIQPLTDQCIRQAERFDRLAEQYGYESKYHPRLKEPSDDA